MGNTTILKEIFSLTKDITVGTLVSVISTIGRGLKELLEKNEND